MDKILNVLITDRIMVGILILGLIIFVIWATYNYTGSFQQERQTVKVLEINSHTNLLGTRISYTISSNVETFRIAGILHSQITAGEIYILDIEGWGLLGKRIVVQVKQAN